MNPAEGNPGINRLAQAIQSRIRQNQDVNNALILDFGTIQPDYSLLTNTYPIPIPKKDYMVCRQLTLGLAWEHLTYTTEPGNSLDGKHDHPSCPALGSHKQDGEHQHDVLIPPTMRKLLPGDRVLVAWVQNDAVVVDLIFPATAL